jgi:hypothetical protein
MADVLGQISETLPAFEDRLAMMRRTSPIRILKNRH